MLLNAADFPFRDLTPRQADVLRRMAKGDDIIYDKGRGYVGHSPLSGRTLFSFLRMIPCPIKRISHDSDGCEVYIINQYGRQWVQSL